MRFVTLVFVIVSFLFIDSCTSYRRIVKKYKKTKQEVKQERNVEISKELPKLSGFLDVTDVYGLNSVKGERFYLFDYDGDNVRDLLVLESNYSKIFFYRFDKEKQQFIYDDKDWLPNDVIASNLLIFDFNRDGLKDILVSVFNQKSELNKISLRLFIASKQIQTDANNNAVVSGSSIKYNEKNTILSKDTFPISSLNVLDFDLDGILDLYIGNWYSYKEQRKLVPDKLFRGTGDDFEDVSDILDGENFWNSSNEQFENARPTNGVSICDIDQNGYPDILTASSNGFANKLWLNQEDKNRNRIFYDVGKDSSYSADDNGVFNLQGGGNTFFANCFDYNDDGFFDVAMGELSHSYDVDSVDRSSILTGSTISTPLKFIRTQYYMDDGSINWNQGDRRASWADLDFDMRADLIIDNSGFPPNTKLVFFHQEENHDFTDMAKSYGIDLINPAGTVVSDLNNDGKLDLLIGRTNLRNDSLDNTIKVFLNDLPALNRKFLKVHLRGRRSNPDAIGAMIQFNLGKKILKRFVDSGAEGNLSSQSDREIIISLNSVRNVENSNYTFNSNKDSFSLDYNVNNLDSIIVKWPYKGKNRSYTPILRTSYDVKKDLAEFFQTHDVAELLLDENGFYFIK